MVAHFKILNYTEKIAGKIPFCSNLLNILLFTAFSTNFM